MASESDEENLFSRYVNTKHTDINQSSSSDAEPETNPVLNTKSRKRKGTLR